MIENFHIRPLSLENDLPRICHWVKQPYAQYWGMNNKSDTQIKDIYHQLASSNHTSVFIGIQHEKPLFLFEQYLPKSYAVAEHFAVKPGDYGMHLLVAPIKNKIPHLTRDIMNAVIEFLFKNKDIKRIVVEPDFYNKKIHKLNQHVGFNYQRIIQLPDKIAHLAFLSRNKFKQSKANNKNNKIRTNNLMYLNPNIWEKVNRAHLGKIISELAHELIIVPQKMISVTKKNHYEIYGDNNEIKYSFQSNRLELDHWQINTDSIIKTIKGKKHQLSSLDFINEFKNQLGVQQELLPTYLEEIVSTLNSAAFKMMHQRFTATELTRASYQDIESSMTQGHPTFIANNGRIGFNSTDYQHYAPECASPISITWLAARRENVVFSSIRNISYENLIKHEFDSKTIEQFNQLLIDKNLDPKQYLWLPTHPWQWNNKIKTSFAHEIATNQLVYLGESNDTYLAQQSIRTLFNESCHHKHYIKMSLSILNMGFMRGLSPDYMFCTPSINDWVNDLIINDEYLQEKKFSILREVAGIGYKNSHFINTTTTASPYRKFLSALWRESPIPTLNKGQRLMTMAAMLHQDNNNQSLLSELIHSSGLTASAWLENYLACYLSPLLHCFYAYDLVFMPHGENIILVLEKNIPFRAIMKDIGEEIALLNNNSNLPYDIQRIAVEIPGSIKLLSIFTDIFDCFFRYLIDVLLQNNLCSQDTFWCLVAKCIHHYQQHHPEHADKFKKHDLFTPQFQRSCLNRLQLQNNKQIIDLQDPAKNLKLYGLLNNPIAKYRSLII